MKSFIAVLFCFILSSVSAQNRIGEIVDIRLGEDIPTNMPHIKQWMDSTVMHFFIGDLAKTESMSSNQENIYFCIIGRKDIHRILPNTSGTDLVFNPSINTATKSRTQRYRVQYNIDRKAYNIRYEPNDYTYDIWEYFDSALKVINLSRNGNAERTSLLANTLNYMIEDGSDKVSKFNRIIKDINFKKKTKIPLVDEDCTLFLFEEHLDKYFTNTKKLIYDIYIANKDKKIAERNLNRFFVIAGIFNGDVVRAIDEMSNPRFQVAMDNEEEIILPNMLKTDAGPSIFKYDFLTGSLDYKNRKLEITFSGRLKDKTMFVGGNILNYNESIVKKIKINSDNKREADFDKLKLVVTESAVVMEVQDKKGYYYEIFNNPWPINTK